MKLHAIIIGHDGNVGKAIVAACLKEGWKWSTDPTDWPDGAWPDSDTVVFDCGSPGYEGYRPYAWTNYMQPLQRAINVLERCNANPRVRAVFLCSTWWASVRGDCPYVAAKRLIEDLAQAATLFGRFPVVVDRIGMEVPASEDLAGCPPAPRRFQESLRNLPGELGERAIASVLYAIHRHQVREWVDS